MRRRFTTKTKPAPPAQETIKRLIALKGLQSKITSDTFWKLYFKLRNEFYRSVEWRNLTPKARRVCFRNPRHKEPLDRHHVIHIFDRPDLALDPANVVYSCRPCHKKEHY